VVAERAIRGGQHESHQQELTAVEQQIASAEAAINRYLKAFEAGQLEAGTCSERVRTSRRSWAN